MDAVLNVLQAYWWRAMTGGRSKPMKQRLCRLADYLLIGLDGRVFLKPTFSWVQAKRHLLNNATKSAMERAFWLSSKTRMGVSPELWS